MHHLGFISCIELDLVDVPNVMSVACVSDSSKQIEWQLCPELSPQSNLQPFGATCPHKPQAWVTANANCQTDISDYKAGWHHSKPSPLLLADAVAIAMDHTDCAVMVSSVQLYHAQITGGDVLWYGRKPCWREWQGFDKSDESAGLNLFLKSNEQHFAKKKTCLQWRNMAVSSIRGSLVGAHAEGTCDH